MKEQFNVTVYYSTEDGTAATFKAQIEFSCDPKTYGNGYYMGVKSSAEAFGFQAYDIRYDHDFDKNYMMDYIVAFYSHRLTGKDGAWKLTGIRIHEAEFDINE